MCDQSDMIEEAALLIETYSVELANCWRNKPFNRVILARAFAMESLGDKDPSETDPLPHVLLLQRIAYIDQSMRKASCSISDPFGFVLILDGMPIAHSDNPMNYDDSDLDTLEMRHFILMLCIRNSLKKAKMMSGFTVGLLKIHRFT